MEQLLEQLATVEQNKDFDLSTSLRDVVSHDILTMIFGLQNQEVSSLWTAWSKIRLKKNQSLLKSGTMHNSVTIQHKVQNNHFNTQQLKKSKMLYIF